MPTEPSGTTPPQQGLMVHPQAPLGTGMASPGIAHPEWHIGPGVLQEHGDGDGDEMGLKMR